MQEYVWRKSSLSLPRPPIAITSPRSALTILPDTKEMSEDANPTNAVWTDVLLQQLGLIRRLHAAVHDDHGPNRRLLANRNDPAAFLREASEGGNARFKGS
jgi:hypothetical protein